MFEEWIDFYGTEVKMSLNYLKNEYLIEIWVFLFLMHNILWTTVFFNLMKDYFFKKSGQAKQMYRVKPPFKMFN